MYCSPHPLLQYVIARYHYYENENAGQCGNLYEFIPTGRNMITFYFNDSLRKFVDGGFAKVPETLIVCPQFTPVKLLFIKPVKLVTIELQPGGLFQLIQMDMDKWPDAQFNGGDVFGKKFNDLLQRIINMQSFNEMVPHIDAYFIEELKRRSQNIFFERIFSHLSFYTKIESIADKANLSIRQMERLCKKHLGMSPKLLLRQKRFSDAYGYKEMNPEKKWAEVAYQFGYCDQMHLIKDFKDFTGKTPAVFFEENQNPVQFLKHFTA